VQRTQSYYLSVGNNIEFFHLYVGSWVISEVACSQYSIMWLEIWVLPFMSLYHLGKNRHQNKFLKVFIGIMHLVFFSDHRTIILVVLTLCSLGRWAGIISPSLRVDINVYKARIQYYVLSFSVCYYYT